MGSEFSADCGGLAVTCLTGRSPSLSLRVAGRAKAPVPTHSRVGFPFRERFPHSYRNFLASGLSENSNKEIRWRSRKSPPFDRLRAGFLLKAGRSGAPVFFPADFVSAEDAKKKWSGRRMTRRSNENYQKQERAGRSRFLFARAREHGLPMSKPWGIRISSHFGTVAESPASKFFEIKILPASDCAPRSCSIFSPNSMIPIYRGGRGVPLSSPTSPILGTLFQGRLTAHRTTKIFESNKSRDFEPCVRFAIT